MPEASLPAAGARRGLVMAILLLGGFLPPADFFIVNVALPSIQKGLGAGAAAVQLVISGYAAGYAVFLVTGGRLGDLFGRRQESAQQQDRHHQAAARAGGGQGRFGHARYSLRQRRGGWRRA